MACTLQPWQVFLAALAGWINRHQQAAIDFLREANRVLLEQFGDRPIRLTDDERRRLAAAGKVVGRVLTSVILRSIEGETRVTKTPTSLRSKADRASFVHLDRSSGCRTYGHTPLTLGAPLLRFP